STPGPDGRAPHTPRPAGGDPQTPGRGRALAMRLATWNVTSVRSRLDHLTAWLSRAAPDVLCMQETKVEDDLFPHAALAECGYRTVAFGQKTYNGVAIAAKLGLGVEDVKKNLDGEPADAHKRLIAATIEGVRVINVYVPNGQAVG